MIRHLLFWLSSRLPLRVIAEDGKPYLERYYVASLFGLRVYLHRFVGSDPARGLHDHPWRWAVSLVLAGFYIEERRTGTAPVRWLNVLTGDTFHRVVLPDGERDAWTLFIHRQGRAKSWGFLRAFPNESTLLWSAYAYTAGEGNEESHWWLGAPKGRDEARRVSA